MQSGYNLHLTKWQFVLFPSDGFFPGRVSRSSSRVWRSSWTRWWRGSLAVKVESLEGRSNFCIIAVLSSTRTISMRKDNNNNNNDNDNDDDNDDNDNDNSPGSRRWRTWCWAGHPWWWNLKTGGEELKCGTWKRFVTFSWKIFVTFSWIFFVTFSFSPSFLFLFFHPGVFFTYQWFFDPPSVVARLQRG